MKKICISKDWKLSLDGGKHYCDVDLPNDYTITLPRDKDAADHGSNAFVPGKNGRYVKYLSGITDSHVILDVDGAYMCASVYLNEDLLSMHPHGYTPYLQDLSAKFRPGRTNKLVIRTEGIQPSTRWYSGAGVYRDVFLWLGGSIRIEPRDVFVTTPCVSEEKAIVKVNYVISADEAKEITVKAAVSSIACTEKKVELSAGKNAVELEMTVEQPSLWDEDNPYLYTLHTELLCEGNVLDTDDTNFGIRSIVVNAKDGLLVNGKSVLLRGGCIHHDHGALGAAAFPCAEERKLRLLKEAGFNSVRISHNPPSLALLEAADRLGMYVMDEAFDMWVNPKSPLDYHLWFADWWDRDLSYMVLRDRNHPSVLSYSFGNEVPERDGNSDGALWARKMAAKIRECDSTRPVTATACVMWEKPESIDPEDYKTDYLKGYADIGNGETDTSWDERTKGMFEPLDICGYNYLWERYEYDHEKYPERVIWGSETHKIPLYDSWKKVKELPYVIGDYTWTAMDNLGEVGTGRWAWARDGVINGISLAGWPWRSCFQGDLDLCGFKMPAAYFRRAVWMGDSVKLFTTHPEHYREGFTGTAWHWYDVHDTWTFEDKYLGSPVKCEVYADADEAEWSINGRILGRSKVEKCIATFDIPYEKGEISVTCYKNGKIVGSDSIKTVGKPAKVALKAEKTFVKADGRDLLYVDVEVQDQDGNRMVTDGSVLSCVVSGGELLAFFSGDPCNEDQYGSNQCHTFLGRALVVVKVTSPGEVTVTVGGNSLAADTVKVMAE